jgi:hypothetical protein
MKRFAMSFVLAFFACAATMTRAQATTYSFTTVNYPDDTFTQLLGINNSDMIAGYHGATVNKGFVLKLPGTFTDQNFPSSAQTQVIGINNSNETVGFYIDTTGVTHGFERKTGITWRTVDFPGTTFNQLLGVNDMNQTAGYYANSANIDQGYTYDTAISLRSFAGIWRVIVNPLATAEGSQVTGINNLQQICGFYIDTKGVNHGFLLVPGLFKTLNYPSSTFTQALGLSNKNLVVGTYNDAGGATHGFIYNSASSSYQSVDDPNGIGTTVINGINDNGWIVGFYVDSAGNTDGFVATPS